MEEQWAQRSQRTRVLQRTADQPTRQSRFPDRTASRWESSSLVRLMLRLHLRCRLPFSTLNLHSKNNRNENKISRRISLRCTKIMLERCQINFVKQRFSFDCSRKACSHLYRKTFRLFCERFEWKLDHKAYRRTFGVGVQRWSISGRQVVVRKMKTSKLCVRLVES